MAARRRPQISRDMAMAELARCFGEDRAHEVVRALIGEVWIFRTVNEEDLPWDVINHGGAVYLTELDAYKAAGAWMLDHIEQVRPELEEEEGWNLDSLRAAIEGNSVAPLRGWAGMWNQGGGDHGIDGYMIDIQSETVSRP